MIVCPMLKEAEAVRSVLPSAHVMVVGIGKVASAIKTARLVGRFRPIRVLLVGCAGAVGGMLRQGDLVVPDAAVEWDFDDGTGKMRRISVHDEYAREVRSALGIGTAALVATGDRFAPADPRVAASGAVAVDMETASVAMACMECGVPFCAVRVISDTPGDADSYRRFWERPARWFEFVRGIPEGLR